MADDVHYEGNGWMTSTCLHHPGAPMMLWRLLQTFGYREPPTYVGKMFMDGGELWYHVHVAVPATPAFPAWEPWTVSAVGCEMHDTCGIAALTALTKFCTDHPQELEGTPLAFLPVEDPTNEVWNRRMDAVLDVRHPRYNPFVAVPVYYAANVHALHRKREEEISLYHGALALCEARDEAKNAQIDGLLLQVHHQGQQIEELIAQRNAAQQMVAQLMAAQVPPAPPVPQVPADVIDLQYGEQLDDEFDA